MLVRLNLALPFHERVQAALRLDPAAVLHAPLGVRPRAAGLELFLPCRAPGPEPAHARVFRCPAHLRGVTHHYWRAFDRKNYGTPTLDLALEEAGGCSAALLVGREVIPVGEVVVPGRRMERWTPAVPPDPRDGETPAEGRFSRYVGALGGSAIHARLRGLHVAIVGVARLGSGLAVAFARAGVHRLTLIDGDLLEEHSIDAVECDPADVGTPKVRAVAAHLARIAPATEVLAVPHALESPEAFEACLSADLVVSAPDENRARLAASLAANACLRPHLDLGSGVFRENAGWSAGADIRLMLPDAGCLLCAGGIGLARRRPRDWRRQRMGSLRSLNQIAVGQAVALTERLVAGDLSRSIWMRLLLGRDGVLTTQEIAWTPAEDCPLCRRTLGSGFVSPSGGRQGGQEGN